MSLKLLACIFVLTLAAVACEGDSRNQFFSGLSSPNPVSTWKVEEISDVDNEDTEDGILKTMMGLSEDISNVSLGSAVERDDRFGLLPLIFSLRSEFRQLVKVRNENKEIRKRSLSALQDLFAWRKDQASIFYTLISQFVPSL